MKKHIALLLAFVLLLTGCGAPASNPSDETTQPAVVQEDPGADDTLNVLLIGNSFSFFFGDALVRMVDAAGVKANIYSVYYPGCQVKMHWNWAQKNAPFYQLRLHRADGEPVDIMDASLEVCLSQQNWDVITAQQHFIPSMVTSYEKAVKETRPYADNILKFVGERFPKTHLAWYETWTFEVGYTKDGLTIDQKFMEDSQDVISRISEEIARDNGAGKIPCGDAWRIARATPGIGPLTRADLSHDDTVGGHYLNACVWYEYLTGLDCHDNTWIPGDGLGYSIAEEKVLMIQNAAHQAIAENPIEEKFV